jgi:hypothetical protein
VTAETAVVLPVLVAMTVALGWLLSLVVTEVRVVDAARETARAAARAESPGEAVQRGRRVAPEGARFTVSSEGDSVVVSVRAEVHGPGGLLRFLPGLPVAARAVAAKEPS